MTTPRTAVGAVTAATLGLLLAGCASPVQTVSHAEEAPDVTRESGFYVNPETSAAQWVADNPDDPRAALIEERIAGVAQATWFADHDPGTIEAEVDALASAAEADGTVPVMVVYNVPGRDCGNHSDGGAPDHESYRAWIDSFAAGLDGRPATIVIEPDALSLMGTCEGQPPAEVMDSIAYAGGTLREASDQARVYLDIGHSDWHAPEDVAELLHGVDAGQNAHGIATNTSNYRTTADEVAYAEAIVAASGLDLTAIVDTSRNGNGPSEDSEWCDPPGRALGTATTADTGSPVVDAFVWVKLPGEADGCAGPAGSFIPDIAFELADNTGG
ncbi:MAG TPA: glycoside hydrolase family 6 protein [Nocardiopsis listeri]|uniref:glycoside hydrolase family 6 protein n=1 Tax=Nocardiopsis listeri TaxID=53440 RepID=UPI001DA51005|nr:glycoside hydrolase family 6 protein [Nocardiopsis listeri]HJE60729.1 glycoside hydrolase family 6 protein [Nocardiopsis listeri]